VPEGGDRHARGRAVPLRGHLIPQGPLLRRTRRQQAPDADDSSLPKHALHHWTYSPFSPVRSRILPQEARTSSPRVRPASQWLIGEVEKTSVSKSTCWSRLGAQLEPAPAKHVLK